jgi:hypothetical protein
VCAHAVAGNNLCIPLDATTLNRRTVKARVASNATMLRFYVQEHEGANTDSMDINNRPAAAETIVTRALALPAVSICPMHVLECCCTGC